MKCLIKSVCLSFLLNTCIENLFAQLNLPGSSSFGSKVESGKSYPDMSNSSYKPSFTIDFESNQWMTKQVLKKKEIQMWDETRFQNEILKTPKVSYLHISICEPKLLNRYEEFNWEAVIQDMSGKLIKRATIGNGFVKEKYIWVRFVEDCERYNFRVSLSSNLTNPFKLYLINTLRNCRYEFTIYPNQNLKK